jgi:hypothetical protein
MYKNITAISYQWQYHTTEKLRVIIDTEDESFNTNMIHNRPITPE